MCGHILALSRQVLLFLKRNANIDLATIKNTKLLFHQNGVAILIKFGLSVTFKERIGRHSPGISSRELSVTTHKSALKC